MFQKIKNLDPMTKQFAVACAVHVGTTLAVCAIAIAAGKKRSSN